MIIFYLMLISQY